MSVQYATTVLWDADLIDIEFVNSTSAPAAYKGLAKTAVKVTVDAPSAVTTAGKFVPGAVVYGRTAGGAGKAWLNTGTTAVPVWA